MTASTAATDAKRTVSSSAFTLIELLVVVTIIVVLLALLVPSLDKAMEQAERAVCGAQMHTQDVAFKQYAFDRKRAYPLPVNNGHWPDGGMSTQGGLPGAFTPEYKPASGQCGLFQEKYLQDPSVIYCPSNPGSMISEKLTWRGDTKDATGQPDNNRWYNTYLNYPYFGGGWRSEHDPLRTLVPLIADSFRSPGSRALITDAITIDTGADFPDEASRNHHGSEPSVQDASGQSWATPPAGGNVLTNDGGVVWRPFSQTRLRVQVPKAASFERSFWF